MFHVSLEQAEDGWVVAEVPALPGCVSQGRDDKEALNNVKEAITAWMWAEDQKTLGQEDGRARVLVSVSFCFSRENAGLCPSWDRFLTSPVRKRRKPSVGAGWDRTGQVGSHLVMTKAGERANLSIPQHRELSVGTLRALI